MLKEPTYPIQQQEEDKKYVLKKWDMTETEFDRIMKQPIVSHDIFGYDKISFLPKLLVKLHYIYLYKFAYPLGIKKRIKIA